MHWIYKSPIACGPSRSFLPYNMYISINIIIIILLFDIHFFIFWFKSRSIGWNHLTHISSLAVFYLLFFRLLLLLFVLFRFINSSSLDSMRHEGFWRPYLALALLIDILHTAVVRALGALCETMGTMSGKPHIRQPRTR